MKSSNGIDGQNGRSGFWRDHVEAWSRGGATQAKYCRGHKLKLSTFGYWKRRLAQERAQTEFVEVRLKEAATPVVRDTSNIKLLIGDEFTIEVGDGFSPDALRSLVLAIRDLR